MKPVYCVETTPLEDKRFSITNGIDTIEATYIYAHGSGEEKVNAHWEVEGAGIKEPFYMTKDKVIQKLSDHLAKPIEKPMSAKDAKKMQDEKGSVCAVVSIPVRMIKESDGGTLEDTLSGLAVVGRDGIRASGLKDVKWRIVGTDPDQELLFIRVKGTL